MHTEHITELRKAEAGLKALAEPSSIRRTAELAETAETLSACAAGLADVGDSGAARQHLASAVRVLEAAQAAALAHRRNFLTRPLSHARFALHLGRARGHVHRAWAELDPTHTPPEHP
ncbi:hypothetical protein ACH4SP_10965 [Streptomyces sp. NPDC021093]|uniref:hypothetical protein n=1 Tax=Streptomyces sp. NPDC021093 TaxID=3365112 RepID=UPI0037B2D1A0